MARLRDGESAVRVFPWRAAVLTPSQILIGIGLIVGLAAGSQILAARLRIPALILLLPAGFLAGAATDDVDPNRLFGPAFPQMVSLAVGVILYDAGLGLKLREMTGHTRRVVIRLIWLGTLVTWAFAALFGALFLGVSERAAVMLGAILVVSGPTVVGPLLDYVRPTDRLQRLLVWEGSLIDPVGALLGAVVFHGLVASTRRYPGSRVLQFLGSVGAGLLGAAVGIALLWLIFRVLRLGELLATIAQLAAVIVVVAACDVLRDDSGLIAAIVMGLTASNDRRLQAKGRQPFFETLVTLVLGLLFVSISATITPHSLRHVVLPSLALVLVLVLVTRPLVAAVTAWRTDLTYPERGFVGWMAPRGIVAAATASTFSPALVAAHIGGANKILPATFVVIVATVVLYGLTARPVARRLGVVRPARSRPLLVGGSDWVVDLGLALRSAGLDVLMWAGLDQERRRIGEAGLEIADGGLFAAAAGRRARLEGITSVLLLTAEHDFNALASTMLEEMVDGEVYRLGPPHRAHGVVAPFTRGDVLFGGDLTGDALSRRYTQGERVILRTAGTTDGPLRDHQDLLFVVHANGRLQPVLATEPATAHPGDGLVLIGSASDAASDAAQDAAQDAAPDGVPRPGAARQGEADDGLA